MGSAIRTPHPKLPYLLPGRIALGEAIARSGGGVTVARASRHGERLRTIRLVSPLAGRSPSYLLRQLVAFRSGARAGLGGQPMQPVVATLGISQMIGAAAYAASPPP